MKSLFILNPPSYISLLLFVCFSLPVKAQNEPPVAVDDAYSVDEGGTLNQPAPGVLDNDTDPENNTLIAEKVTDPSNGTLTLNSDGSFTYVHNGSETISDQFTYRAYDGNSYSNTATVSITIAPINDPPVAVNDAYSVDEGGTLNQPAPGVLDNDTDPENNTLIAEKVTDPSNGTLTLNSDGSFTYVHNGSETISDQFTYRAYDGNSYSNTATVSITITPINDPPVAVNDAYSVDEGGTLNQPAPGVLSNDTDAENNTLTAEKVTDPSNGTLTLNSDGSFTYVHNGSETTSDQFTYRAYDGNSYSNTATVSITITPINDPPELSGIETTPLSFTEGADPVRITESLAVTDAENVIFSATVTITNYQNGQDILDYPGGFDDITGSWNAGNGTLSLNSISSGSTPANYQAALRSVTFRNTSVNPVTTTRTITFVVNDGTVNSNQLSRNITIIPVNSPPVLNDPGPPQVSFTENGGAVLITNTLTIIDVDHSTLASALVKITSGFQSSEDILTWESREGISGTYNSTAGELALTGTAPLADYRTALRSVRYNNPSNNPNTVDRVISFTVHDGIAGSNSVTKTVTITSVNDPPVATDVVITAPNNRIGTLHTGSFTFTDPDGDGPGTHTYQWYRRVDAPGAEPASIAGATSITYTPVIDDGGKYIGFEVTPVDEHGLAGPTVRTAAFSYINAAPVATNVRINAPQTQPGATISGRFDYSDKESNPRGNAIYRWYRSDVSNPAPSSPGTLIGTDSTYRLVGLDAGKWIWFRVDPVATTGSSPGDSAWSNIIGPIGQYTASITGSGTFCHGATMPITLTITGGKAPYSAKLSRTGNLPVADSVISGITSSPRTIQVKIPGTYTLTEVSDTDGDKADLTNATPVTFVINPKPKALISGTTAICQGTDTHAGLTLDFNTSVSPWTVTIRRREVFPYNDTTISGITLDPYTFNARVIGAGPTRHRVTAITDANGCPGDTASGSAWLSYKSAPIAAISGTDMICPGESVNLTVRLTSGTIPWSFTYNRNGVNAGTFSNIQTQSQTVTVSQPGIYTLAVVADQSGTGCGTGQAVISTHTPPTAVISGTETICEYTTATLSVALTGESPWKFGYTRNRLLDSTVVQNVNTSPRTIQVKKAGTYRLYEVIDRNGCRGTVSGSGEITVIPAPDVTISGLKAAYNYEKNELDTIIGTPPGGDFIGPGVFANFFIPRIAGLGSHNIVYRYRSSPTGCYGYDTTVVNVLESNATIYFENNRTQYCENDMPFSVTGVNIEGNYGTFSISGGAGLTDHGNNTATVYPALLSPNKYTITYTYHMEGEPFVENAGFDIGPPPVASFSWATECFHAGQSIDFINKSTSSFGYLTDTSYFWKISTPTGFNSDSARNITYTFPEPGIYNIEMKIVNSYGCTHTAIRKFNLRPTHDLKNRYYESFESNPISWQSGQADFPVNSWKLGNPSRHGIPPRGFSGAYSDTVCWYTNITANPAPSENSWVTSPCFDFSNVDKPMLTLHIWRLFNSNRDGANIQATADSGKTWNLVGEIGDGENWFNTSYIQGEPGGKDNGWSNAGGTGNDSYWVRARHGLDYLKGKKEVQFRIAYGSANSPQNNDGIAFDDFTISERNKMTLIEHFTNTNLSESSKADSILDAFTDVYGMNAINIQYHTSNPQGDPFYEDNPLIPTSRQFYYGLSSVPYAVIDGGHINSHLIDYIAGSKPLDKNVIIRQSLSDSEFNVRIDDAVRSDQILNVKVTVIANEDIPLTELSVRTAIVESVVEGVRGANGDTLFRNVVRTLLPDAAGATFYQPWKRLDTRSVENAWTIENVTDPNRLMVVAFIQDEGTREIFNVTVKNVDFADNISDPKPDPRKEAQFSVYPNPARQVVFVKLNEQTKNEIIVELFNSTGNLVYSATIPAGSSIAEIPVDDYLNGLYMLRLKERNKLLGVSKLLISK